MMKNKNVKVLMVGNHKSIKGGITSVVTQLLSHDWSGDGVDMRYIPTYKGGSNIMKIVYFALSYIRIFVSILFCRPDLIHAHMSYKGSFHRKYYLYKLSVFFNIKYVVHLHGSQFKDYYYGSSNKQKAKISQLLSGCHRMIVLGEEWDKAIKSIEPTAKTIIIQNAIRIPEEKIQWNEDVLKVLFLGVLIARKGVSDLLDAIGVLHKEGHLDKLNRDIKFIIAGSGEQEDMLKKKADDLGIVNYVEFTGWVTADEKPSYLMDSQFMVLPSYNEGLPVAILEAISYGLPIISTKVGSIDEAVVQNKNGCLIEPGDISSLISEVLKYINMDKSEWQNYSQFSREYAIEKFSQDEYFKSILSLYK